MVDFIMQPRLDVFHSSLVRNARFSAKYELPILERTSNAPKKAIPFEKASKTSDHQQWVHFYTHDYRFECLWKNPKQYLKMLQRFEGVITTDFSLYRELPLAMQIWNTYRNRALAYWLQTNGMAIVPNVRWGDERTYGFAFEGLPTGGSVATSTCGCIQNRLDRLYFKKGLAKMVETLRPETIVNYSQTPDNIFKEYADQGICVIKIENYALSVRKEMG